MRLVLILGLIAFVRSELKVLSNEALQEAVQGGDSVVVTFSNLRCAACDEMVATLDKLSEEIESVSFSNIRGDLDPGILDDLHIREFPTTIMFHHGHPEIYDTQDKTDEDSVRQFIDSVLARKTVQFVESGIADLVRTTLEEEKQVLFIAEVKSKDSEAANTFEEIASGMRSVAQFAAFVNPQVTKETVRVYRPLEGLDSDGHYRSVASLSKMTHGRLYRFMRAELVPAFGAPRPPMFYLSRQVLYYAGTPEEIEAARPVLEKVGQKSRPEVSVVAVELPKLSEFASQYIGMPGPFPQLMANIDEPTFTRRYIFEGELEVSAVEDFILDSQEKRLKRYFRSEEIDSNEGLQRPKNVLKLVNRNIKETIKENAKHHFFTLVHAEWCEHCGPALEAFFKVAEEYIDNDHVMFGTFEASKNDPPTREFTTPHFPAIFHAAAGSSFSMDYRIPINYDELIQMVEESLEGERILIEEKLRKHFDTDDEEEDDVVISPSEDKRDEL